VTSDLDLDHLGIAVKDLDAAAAHFRALGFTLTDKSWHVAPRIPGGALERTGTGNHCVMLEQGYVELIAVTDPAYQGRLRQDLARYEGLHLVSFGSDDAAATAALFARTTGVATAPRRLARPIAERGVARTLSFDIVDLPDDVAGFGHFFAIQHLTRDLLWQPHLLRHDNGTTALLGAVACTADPAGWLQRLAKAIGTAPDGDAIALRHGTLIALDPAALARRFPGMTPPALPSLVALTLGCADLGLLRAAWQGNGVTFHEAPERLWIAASAAHGTILEFVERR
jgi:catechol 2,3-dioxygenase-like lactoylglutathione lyase family enzyme